MRHNNRKTYTWVISFHALLHITLLKPLTPSLMYNSIFSTCKPNGFYLIPTVVQTKNCFRNIIISIQMVVINSYNPRTTSQSQNIKLQFYNLTAWIWRNICNIHILYIMLYKSSLSHNTTACSTKYLVITNSKSTIPSDSND